MNEGTGRVRRRIVLSLLLCLLAFTGRCVRPGPGRRASLDPPAVPSSPTGIPAASPSEPAAVTPAQAGAPSGGLFAASVRPILASRCSPCHEPGGKMYERLPFDQAAVVASHSTGISRRLREEERETLERWIATLPRAGTSR